MIRKRRSLNAEKIIITFEIPGTVWAERINLVGDFNNWDREGLSLQQNRDGNWQIELELDEGREYRFRYLLDGQHWRDDWYADRFVPNPYGGHDSVVIAQVALEPEE